jgi:hypothetical protein
MKALDIFKQIAEKFPESNPQTTSFPSGAAMLDFTIGEIRYCVEYLPRPLENSRGHTVLGWC